MCRGGQRHGVRPRWHRRRGIMPPPGRLTSCWVVAACCAEGSKRREKGCLRRAACAHAAGISAAKLVPVGPAHRPERPHTTRDREKENITAVAAQPSCTIRGSPCMGKRGQRSRDEGTSWQNSLRLQATTLRF